jgi:TolA-binding protein
MQVKRRSIFCLFAAVVISIAGCAGIQSAQPQQGNTSNQAEQAEPPDRQDKEQQAETPDPAEVHISAAAALLARGDIEGALRENQKALTLAGKKPPGDMAIYNMGLIYLHYKNAQRNYEKARTQFERIVKEYPDSPLLEEAKIWSGVLQVIEKLKQVDIEIEEKKKELSR